ncbi:sterol carrier family protein [Arthrobacter sp. NPDC058130]|uniref:sterol carrier family protein n=1 Tax=Arthrobacter sp. NPDC058130 TaxID=3346353 RepID=UPI0036ED2E65
MAVSRRRIAVDEGRAALAAWQAANPAAPDTEGAGAAAPDTEGAGAAAPDTEGAGVVPRATIATAVRYSLEEVTARAPGNSVEVRVPPFGVTQCVEGPRHTRGTPPNVIECDAATWLAMVSGQLSWADAVAAGNVAASGLRADLSALLPL